MNGIEKTGSGVLILSGNDSLSKLNYRQKFISEIKKTHGEYLLVNYDPTEETLSYFLQKMITPSMFEETRVFLLTHIQSLSEKELEEINSYLDYDLDVYLIIEGEEKDNKKTKDSPGDKGFPKKLGLKKRSSDPRFEIKKFLRPPDYKIAEWLVSNIGQLFSRSISQSDAEYLVDLVGYDLEALYSELQKIDIHLPPGEPVNKKCIDLISGANRAMTVYELTSALGEKNLPRALDIVDSLFSYKFAAPLMVSALFKHFWALYRIRRFSKTNPGVIKAFYSKDYSASNDAALRIGQAAGLLTEKDKKKVYPVIIKSGIVSQARNYSDKQLRNIIRLLYEFDTGVKSGRITPTQNDVQMFCCKIVRAEVCEIEGAL
ncbi:DNA polymerase III delta subunit [Chitinispirillum alkaliphilum]|nr:DNA polymerase III delta subunit [Chitinispirillum alkaliphilum]